MRAYIYVSSEERLTELTIWPRAAQQQRCDRGATEVQQRCNRHIFSSTGAAEVQQRCNRHIFSSMRAYIYVSSEERLTELTIWPRAAQQQRCDRGATEVQQRCNTHK
jgi:hypothetical protein